MLINVHTHIRTKADINLLNIYPEDKVPILDLPNMLSCGIHPWFIKNYSVKDTLRELENLCQNQQISAIGECGLDKNATNIEVQKQVFELQVDLSEKYKLPIIIHSFRTYSDMLEIYKIKKCKQTWIIHGFTGSKEMAKQFAMRNIFISLGNYLLSQPTKAKELLNQLDMNFVLFETDDKDIEIEDVYKVAADSLGCSFGELESKIENNFNRIFK